MSVACVKQGVEFISDQLALLNKLLIYFIPEMFAISVPIFMKTYEGIRKLVLNATTPTLVLFRSSLERMTSDKHRMFVIETVILP